MPHILIVDDNPDNLYMLEVLLQRNGFETVSAANGRAALEMAQDNSPQMIISDILMSVMDGYALCKAWKADETLKQIPFVFYTATYTEAKDIAFGLKLGAERFLIKPMEAEPLLDVVHEVLSEHYSQSAASSEPAGEEEMALLKQYNETLFRKLQKKVDDLEASNLRLQKEIEKRFQTETQLRRSEAQLKTLLNALPVGLAWCNTCDNSKHLNEKFTELFGYTVDDIPVNPEGVPPALPDKPNSEDFWTMWSEVIRNAGATGISTSPLDVSVTCKNGEKKEVSIIGTIINHLHLTVFADVTERRRLEEQLAQAQKLESIGNLAGGIAHDFNNVLTAITGFGGLLRMKMPSADPLMPYVDELIAAGMRGAALTHQLLAFSRKQIMDMKPVDLNKTLGNLEKMLRRLIREDITLRCETSTEPFFILADATQMEQVIINLVTNARDAMPDGGKMIISTGASFIDETFLRHHAEGESAFGQYAFISIRDSGMGMAPQTRQKIFEPFFTTKDIGKGTGLGLSVVYGIVRQHKGMIHVESEPGSGAVFTIYLPILKEVLDAEKPAPKPIEGQKGTETLLVAEDNEALRRMTKEVLEDYGYKVISAADGKAALDAFRRHPESIDMVILDLIMPGKRGFEVYKEIVGETSRIKALFMTGHSEDEAKFGEIRRNALPLLRKPFSPHELLHSVREVLDGEYTVTN